MESVSSRGAMLVSVSQRGGGSQYLFPNRKRELRIVSSRNQGTRICFRQRAEVQDLRSIGGEPWNLFSPRNG